MGRMKDLFMVCEDLKAEGKPLSFEVFKACIMRSLAYTENQALNAMVFLQNYGYIRQDANDNYIFTEEPFNA